MVDPRADAGIITTVYHALAKRYHPDRATAPDAANRMAEINAAYAVLGDYAARERYDRSIGVTDPRNGSAAPEAIKIEPDVASSGFGSSGTREQSPYGEAGPPPPYPYPSGSALSFGRYRGWTLIQVDSYDNNYLEWLRRTPTGRQFTGEIDMILRNRVSA